MNITYCYREKYPHAFAVKKFHTQKSQCTINRAATDIWVRTNSLIEISGSAEFTQPLQASCNESFAVEDALFEFTVETVGIGVR
jgi:hypothetical protein